MITNKILLSDGSFSAVYRISPFVQHQFDIVEMDRLLALANDKLGNKYDNKAENENTQEVIPDNASEELFVENKDNNDIVNTDDPLQENTNI